MIKPYRHSTGNDGCICDITEDNALEIINLTPYTFSPEELAMLKLGLNFCPGSDMDHFDIVKALNLFARKLNFKYQLEGSGPSSDELSESKRVLSDGSSLAWSAEP